MSRHNNPGSLKTRRGKLFRLQNGKCFWCNEEMHFSEGQHYQPRRVTIDHILPVSQGGTHELDNLVAACLECNSKRNSLDSNRVKQVQGTPSQSKPGL